MSVQLFESSQPSNQQDESEICTTGNSTILESDAGGRIRQTIAHGKSKDVRGGKRKIRRSKYQTRRRRSGSFEAGGREGMEGMEGFNKEGVRGAGGGGGGGSGVAGLDQHQRNDMSG